MAMYSTTLCIILPGSTCTSKCSSCHYSFLMSSCIFSPDLFEVHLRLWTHVTTYPILCCGTGGMALCVFWIWIGAVRCSLVLIVAAGHDLHFAALHTLLPWGFKHRTIIAHACAVFACFIAALVAYLKYDQSCILGQVSLQ